MDHWLIQLSPGSSQGSETDPSGLRRLDKSISGVKNQWNMEI